MKMSNKPTGMTEEHLLYLDDLRESGRTNMFGAAEYLTNEMNVPHLEAKAILVYWMKTFEARHPQ
jgi:hypothetical protein